MIRRLVGQSGVKSLDLFPFAFQALLDFQQECGVMFDQFFDLIFRPQADYI
jgi:hypothetical protein